MRCSFASATLMRVLNYCQYYRDRSTCRTGAPRVAILEQSSCSAWIVAGSLVGLSSQSRRLHRRGLFQAELLDGVSRILYFWILPVTVIGKLSVNCQ